MPQEQNAERRAHLRGTHVHSPPATRKNAGTRRIGRSDLAAGELEERANAFAAATLDFLGGGSFTEFMQATSTSHP